MKTGKTYEQREHDRLVRVVRQVGWKMTRAQRAEIVREVETWGLVLPMRLGKRFWREWFDCGYATVVMGSRGCPGVFKVAEGYVEILPTNNYGQPIPLLAAS